VRVDTCLFANGCLAVLLWALPGFANAQSTSPEICTASTAVTGSLITLIDSGVRKFTCLERQSAIANQATYNRLTSDPDGVNGPQSPICDPLALRPQSATCAGATLRVFLNTRELVHTANELLGGGAGRPTIYSLGSDAQGLGFALRWTAAEEMLVPSQLSTEFSNSQTMSALGRLSALRLGSRGFSVAGLFDDNTSITSAKGGAASADDEELASKWGGFLNGTSSWGDRAPSDQVDAFDFDGQELTLGVDYRFTDRLVAGGMLGYSKQTVEFDSSQSVVAGDMKTKGNGLTLYAMQEWKGPYLSGSLGVQRVSIDSRRVINYPSFNIFTESVYATATGSTKSTNVTASANLGWPLSVKALGIEPYVRGEYSHIKIDGFSETSVHNIGSQIGQPAGFDLYFNDQSISSFDSVVGLRLQYAFTPRLAVFIPYLVGEWHKNLQDTTTSVNASFNGVGSYGGEFDLSGDRADSSYYVVSGGLSIVIRSGWQGFLQYRTVESLESVRNYSIAFGLRGEF
jgi:outer membrane autotransporter protein